MAGPLNGVRVGADPWAGPEGWLQLSTHPFDGAVCRNHAQYPAFPPDPSELAVVVLVFLCLVVHNLPQLCMYTVTFSPLTFLWILLLEEVSVQV